MGSLFVEIGQCGCQVGAQLNPALAPSPYATRPRPPHRLHAVLVDTEPKVLQPLLALRPQWLDPLNVRYFQHGRGNNWSYGYLHRLSAQQHHPGILPEHPQHSHTLPSPLTLERYLEENRAICEYVLERVRKELESTDCAMAINVVSSLGGGTGSGLGTKIVEKLREEFSLDVLGHFVLPNKSGETPLQAYNCLLSLASLQEHCRALFTYENDKLMALLRGEGECSVQDINAHLAAAIARLVLLNDHPRLGRFYSSLVADCLLSPQLNYLTLLTAENRRGSWEDLFGSLHEQIRNSQQDGYGEQFGRKEHRERLLHGELVLLGRESGFEQSFGKKTRSLLRPLFEDSLLVEEVREREERCSGVLVANHSGILSYLQYLLHSGTAKLQAKAYLWHYQYADLQGALEGVQAVADQYRYLASEKQ